MVEIGNIIGWNFDQWALSCTLYWDHGSTLIRCASVDEYHTLMRKFVSSYDTFLHEQEAELWKDR